MDLKNISIVRPKKTTLQTFGPRFVHLPSFYKNLIPFSEVLTRERQYLFLMYAMYIDTLNNTSRIAIYTI